MCASLACGLKLAEPEEVKLSIKEGLSKVLRELLGRTGEEALKFHLKRILKQDVYETFYDDPFKFYDSLKRFLSSGAEPLMRLIIQKLIERGFIGGLTPQFFLELLNNRDERSKRMIKSSFKIPKGG